MDILLYVGTLICFENDDFAKYINSSVSIRILEFVFVSHVSRYGRLMLRLKGIYWVIRYTRLHFSPLPPCPLLITFDYLRETRQPL